MHILSLLPRVFAVCLVAVLYSRLKVPRKSPPPFADVHGEVRYVTSDTASDVDTDTHVPLQAASADGQAQPLHVFPFPRARALEITRVSQGSQGAVWQSVEGEGVVTDPDEFQSTAVVRLSPVLGKEEVSHLFGISQDLTYGQGADSVDGLPAFEAHVTADGRVIDPKTTELLRPLVEDRLLPYLHQRYNCSSCVVCTIIIRRYVPGERRQHPWHFDNQAFLTAVVPLSPSGDYVGGLFVQPGFDRDGRQFLALAAGDAVIHDYRLRHGVDVMSGERTALILWVKSDAASCERRTSPWYAKAALSGDPRAQYNLGQILRVGDGGTTPDKAGGIAWLRRAAEQGHGLAMHNLAVAAEVGEGMQPDPAEAVLWYSRAAGRGLPQSMVTLGAAYRIGYGPLVKNATEAATWFRRAALQDDEDAMYHLAAMLALGEGIASNVTEAQGWYALAEGRGDPANPLRLEAASALLKCDEQPAVDRTAATGP